MTDLIALNKLVASTDNARKTGIADGIEELAASIAAHGLLQSLVVRKTSRGKFAVIAGQRRRMALSLLAEQRQHPFGHADCLHRAFQGRRCRRNQPR